MAQLLTQPQFISRISESTDAALTNQRQSLARLSPDGDQLAQYMQQTIMGNGKRTRPYLFYLVYVGLNPNTSDFSWELATAIELYHQFLLIHDDVIDHDTIRHGGPNVAGSYIKQLESLVPEDAQRYELAASMAILAGDLCMSMVYEQISSSDLPGDRKIALARSLHHITEKEIAGQQLDMLFNFRRIKDTSIAQILSMYDYKTSAYTLELPIGWALELNQVSAEQSKLWSDLALTVGKAYQVTDDLIGLFSDSQTTGKPIGGDIREGKKTVLLRLAYEQLEPQEWNQIENMLGHPLTEAELSPLLELLRRRHIEKQAIVFAESLVNDARHILTRLHIADPSRAEITKILDGLSTRRV